MPFPESHQRLNVSMVKNQNRQLVFRHVFRNSPVTRAVIASETGLSQGTVKTIVDELLRAGIVEEKKDTSAPVGRKPHKVALNPAARTLCVINIQPDRIALHSLNLALEPASDPIADSLPASGDYGKHLRSYLNQHKPALEVSGVGVVVPGAYDPRSDRVRCHIMPELSHVPIGEIVHEVSGMPPSIGEDVHVAASAEARYPFNAEQPLFFLFAGSGVGGCFVNEDRVLQGANRMAGEIGQVTTRTGRRLEEVIRWTSFAEACGIPVATGTSETQSENATSLLLNGDPAAIGALTCVVQHLSEALESVICILNPRTILIGGPYGRLGNTLLDPLRAEVDKRLMPEHREGLRILTARAGTDGMVRGAAFEVLEAWLEREFSVGGDS